MPMIDWAKPLAFQVSDPSGGKAMLQGLYGPDDWNSPSAFAVRLDHVWFTDDGAEKWASVARFDHNGHDAFHWNPPRDGFHIDVYQNGIRDKVWLQTPPPHSTILDVIDYCKDRLYDRGHPEYLFEVYRGKKSFRPGRLGLRPK